MQKFTCGSNAHNSPSFTTHSGLWAWNSPHPLPSASVSFLSLGSDSPVNSQWLPKKSKLISYYGQLTILWMMLITMVFNILRVCIRIYISHHFVFPLLVTKLPLKGYSMTVFQVKCFTDHNSHFFTELLFPEKQNLFSTYINQSFNFTFLHTMTNIITYWHTKHLSQLNKLFFQIFQLTRKIKGPAFFHGNPWLPK